MNPRTILAGLACFAAGAAFALTATDALARPGRAAVPSAYANSVYGFSIVPPTFPKAEADSVTQAAMFFAPGKGGFSSNLGIMVTMTKTTLDEYIKLNQDQFRQAELKITSETRIKVSGRDGVLWEYEASAKGRELKFMVLAVVDRDRVFLLTGAAPKVDYEVLAREFKASLDSFKIQD